LPRRPGRPSRGPGAAARKSGVTRTTWEFAGGGWRGHNSIQNRTKNVSMYGFQPFACRSVSIVSEVLGTLAACRPTGVVSKSHARAHGFFEFPGAPGGGTLFFLSLRGRGGEPVGPGPGRRVRCAVHAQRRRRAADRLR